MGKGYRQGRLGGEIQKLVSSMLLRELKDPRLSGMISISDVDVSKDNSYATCYVSVLTTSKDEEAVRKEEEQVIDGLDSAKGIIRKEIGKQMKLRHVPELTFRIDRSMEYGRHIDEVIKKLEKDNEE
ncbi:30S ribosome-binding factor RbfA [Aminicella lysinilytica]|jgi:ribosome-binding factor A|uniref:Ribosome-binding factor A n=1 Tax=Aminicella lysinilytica TaxID=433323 RepID=A0A4R6QCJ1_9FIRM|nr:30S ribosome-binding factor RbfA [Aminicella lysinilytica]TDP59676.1 ribosome-binding factor A [Aminicella lysinilytica]